MANLEASLRDYIKPEMLEGPNAYSCPQCKSKQPAKKGAMSLCFSLPFFIMILF
jgi:ubiquitin C-terminal hydrolase